MSAVELADYDCTVTGPYICETQGKYPLFTLRTVPPESIPTGIVSNYRPPTKLWEGNAFTPVCLFMGLGGLPSEGRFPPDRDPRLTETPLYTDPPPTETEMPPDRDPSPRQTACDNIIILVRYDASQTSSFMCSRYQYYITHNFWGIWDLIRGL